MKSDQWRSVSVTIITSSRYTTRLTCLLSPDSRDGLLRCIQHFIGTGDLIFNLHTNKYISYFYRIQGVRRRRFWPFVAFSFPDTWFWLSVTFLWGYLWEQAYTLNHSFKNDRDSKRKFLSTRNFFGYHIIYFQIILIRCYPCFAMSGVQLEKLCFIIKFKMFRFYMCLFSNPGKISTILEKLFHSFLYL